MNDRSVTRSNLALRFHSALLAGCIVAAGALPSSGAGDCKPALRLTDVRLSAVTAQQREWTATLAVDESSCATPSGSFRLGFLRIKENAPDLEFVEQVTWTPQERKVSVSFWEDEAPSAYWIDDIAPCACRR